MAVVPRWCPGLSVFGIGAQGVADGGGDGSKHNTAREDADDGFDCASESSVRALDTAIRRWHDNLSIAHSISLRRSLTRLAKTTSVAVGSEVRKFTHIRWTGTTALGESGKCWV